MIKLEGIEKTYISNGKKVHALKHVNLFVHVGEIFGIVGKSGAGKSSLIRCVNLLERPTKGKVIVNHQELTKLSEPELRAARRNIGMVFQHFNLLNSKTVFQNIAFPLQLARWSTAGIRERVNELADWVGLADKLHYYPHQLSGGQKQRVAIARAIATNPPVLLCDEATSSLDPQTTHDILALLRDINQQLEITILLITHEMDVIKQICDRVAVLEAGEVIETQEIADFFIAPKTKTGQNLVKSAIKVELPVRIEKAMHETESANTMPILKIFFHGEASKEPLIAQLIKKFDIQINIIQAKIESIKDETLGVMLAEAIGDKHDVKKAIHYMRELNMTVEVLGYVDRND